MKRLLVGYIFSSGYGVMLQYVISTSQRLIKFLRPWSNFMDKGAELFLDVQFEEQNR